MAENDNKDADETPVRVDVELFIVHPTMSPEEITAALHPQPHIVHPYGARRMAPNGTVLKGTYPDTRWRHSIRYELNGQWFVSKITELVDSLAPHKMFLHRVRDTGGTAKVIVQFLGDGYLGDNVPLDTLAKMTELRLDFGIECFVVPQS